SSSAIRRHDSCPEIEHGENQPVHPIPQPGDVLQSRSSLIPREAKMQQLPVSVSSSIATPRPPTLRDWAAVGFRHARLMAFCFLFIFGAAILVTLFTPRQYEAELKILVKGERADPLVSPDKESVMPRPEVTEQDVNSEVELIKSRDVLEKLALSTGVSPNDTIRLNEAVQELEKNVTAER